MANKENLMTLNNLLEHFSLLDDWEMRYRYIIDLGQALEPLQTQEYADTHKVSGCVSQVWLICEGDKQCLTFRGDSDAHIVKGLISILLTIYSGKSATEITSINSQKIFTQLGLGEHLTPQRSNGFYSIAIRILSEAEARLVPLNL